MTHKVNSIQGAFLRAVFRSVDVYPSRLLKSPLQHAAALPSHSTPGGFEPTKFCQIQGESLEQAGKHTIELERGK